MDDLFNAVRAYHLALRDGWPPPNSSYGGAKNAIQIAAGRIGLKVGADYTKKIRRRLDFAFILGVKIAGWSLESRWPGGEQQAIILRYRSFFPDYERRVSGFNAVETLPPLPDAPVRRAAPAISEEEAEAILDALGPESTPVELPPVPEPEALPPAPDADASREAPSPLSRDALEAARDKERIIGLTASLKSMTSRAMAAEEGLIAYDALHMARIEPPLWMAKPAIAGSVSLTPVLFTSDFQVGEVVKADEIDGINEYNQDIFCERYQAMIERTIMLAEQHTGARDFPGIVYLRGGDAISGEIHDELAETNDLSAVPAVRKVMQQERDGIKRLRDKFGRVRVISLPGNHGRTTFKPHSKHYVDRNFETIISWWLADAFGDDPNVMFWTPRSADALFEVEGWYGLLSHGDRMGSRGGTGFIGPAATIARGHQKLFQNWTATGQRVDFILTGHLHTSLKLERGFANGSLAGYNEYARDLRCLPDAAKQWLLFVHRDTMISHQFELQLSPKPRRHIADATEAQ
jgi:hypothetical protein